MPISSIDAADILDTDGLSITNMSIDKSISELINGVSRIELFLFHLRYNNGPYVRKRQAINVMRRRCFWLRRSCCFFSCSSHKSIVALHLYACIRRRYVVRE